MCSEHGPRTRGWSLAHSHETAHSTALLVVPQLAWLSRDSGAGTFSRPTGPSQFLEELGSKLRESDPVAADNLGDARITIVAHSAGFETARAWLRSPAIAARTDNVILMDSLYAGADEFFAWARGDASRRLVSIYTGGRTEHETQHLLALAHHALNENAIAENPRSLATALSSAQIITLSTTTGHGNIPAHFYAEIEESLEKMATSSR